MKVDQDGARLTHFDEAGAARMVDVGAKAITRREAVARGAVRMQAEIFRRIADRAIEKGDVLGVARVAGIMAAKRTGELIPMCHPLGLSSVTVNFRPRPPQAGATDAVIEIEAVASVEGKTGVEMEALAAVSVAALTIYDMCKAVDRGMVIEGVRLVRKSGGKSGAYVRPGEADLPPEG
jgi:cyclic pyranopterin phosphate synthase